MIKTALALMIISTPLMAAVAMEPAIEGDIWDLIERIVNYILYVTAFFIAPILYVWAALNFMTAAGEMEKINQGKKLFLWTTIGLLAIIISKGFISYLNNVVFQ